MIHIRPEGTATRQGLNLYPWSDTHNRGGVLRIGHLIVRLRWSRTARRFFGGVEWIDPEQERAILQKIQQDLD